MNTACPWVYANDPPTITALLTGLGVFFTQHPRPQACFHHENVHRQLDVLRVEIAHDDGLRFDLLNEHFGDGHIVWDGDRDDGKLIAIVKLDELNTP